MESAKIVGMYVVLMLVIWGAGTIFAEEVSDYVVVEPATDVRCIIVSRMFNTSVDCWTQ